MSQTLSESSSVFNDISFPQVAINHSLNGYHIWVSIAMHIFSYLYLVHYLCNLLGSREHILNLFCNAFLLNA